MQDPAQREWMGSDGMVVRDLTYRVYANNMRVLLLSGGGGPYPD